MSSPKPPTPLDALPVPDAFAAFCHAQGIVTARQALDVVDWWLAREEAHVQLLFNHEELITLRATLIEAMSADEATAQPPADYHQPPPGVPLPVPERAHIQLDDAEE